MIGTSIMKKLPDASVLPLALFSYIFIVAVIEKEAEIVRTKKTEPGNKHRVNQNFNNSIHNEILENKWLSDESINLVQTTQFKTFPLRDFEDTILGTLNIFSVQTGEFIQVLHENNRWVTVSSTTESATSLVYLYDSSQKESLNKNLVKPIALLRKSEDAELCIILKALQQ